MWLGASHLSLGLSFPSKPLFSQSPTSSDMSGSRHEKGLLFRLPFLIRLGEQAHPLSPHCPGALSFTPWLQASPPRPLTMGKAARRRTVVIELLIWNWKELWKCAIHISLELPILDTV